MKKFKNQEIRDLLNQVYHEEISFSRMVEILNDMVDETNKPQYKDGDFVVSEYGSILIFKKKFGNFIYDHAYLAKNLMLLLDSFSPRAHEIKRYATEEEKQELLDALAKKGKRWNAEKKCVEDIPVRKFQKGDKVRIKEGVSNKTQGSVYPYFNVFLYPYIGRVMTVKEYVTACLGEYITTDEAKIEDHHFGFAEDWLEPYVEELKEGDLAIFWDNEKEIAIIKPYGRLIGGEEDYFQHKDQSVFRWINAIKFESKEQFNRFIKGEI